MAKTQIVRIVPNARGLAELRADLAKGFAAVAFDAETEAKREAPVRGGYRSFRPGTRPIGGTLRRSIHSAVYLDGALFARTDIGAEGTTSISIPSRGIAAVIGSNLHYAAYVELGTSKMAARPYLAPALEGAAARAASTMARAIGRRRA